MQLAGRTRQILGGSLLATMLVAGTLVSPASAQKTASSTSVKIGYFNLQMVKASGTGSDAEALKAQAESQLRRDIEAGQKAIQKAREEKKSDEDLKKIVQQVQTELAAKQQALGQLVQTQNAIENNRLIQAVAQVAKDKGLDLIVDGAGVFAGGQKVLDSGVDVTEDIVKTLIPGARKAAAPAAASASGETKTSAK
ncbi:MAG: OmpH family outer membrane protein [Candidatus Melainabacteria bacterium]|nr:OmpH family outer membrane protein [Candidatus Melainabacteria bacterium]